MDFKEFNTSAYLTAMSGRLIKKNNENTESIMSEVNKIFSYITEIIPEEELSKYDINKITKCLLEGRVDPAFSNYVKTSKEDSDHIATMGHYRLGDTYGVEKIDKQLYIKMRVKQRRAS